MPTPENRDISLESDPYGQELASLDAELRRRPGVWQDLEAELINQTLPEYAHDEDRPQWVVTPRVNQELTQIALRARFRPAGATAFFEGPPGVGKSVMARLLADRLRRDGQRVVMINTEPAQQTSSLIAEPLLTPRPLASENYVHQLEVLTKSDSSQSLPQLKLLLNQMMIEATTGFTTAADRQLVGQQLLTKIGLTDLGVNLNADVSSRDALIGLSTQNTNEVVSTLLTYWVNKLLQDKSEGWDVAVKGILYKAATEGWIVIFDEADKMMAALGGFGVGAENLFEPPGGNGDTVQVAGREVRIHPDFRVIATANNVEKIPDHILRRFERVNCNPQIEDLIWQARLMLTNKEGQLTISRQSEHELCQFLLWWSALGRRNDVAFNVNALARLCAFLSTDMDFKTALGQTLRSFSGIADIYYQYQRTASRPAELDFGLTDDIATPTPEKDQLSLRRLNWLANGAVAVSPGRKQVVPNQPRLEQAGAPEPTLAVTTNGVSLDLVWQTGQSITGENIGTVVRSLEVPELKKTLNLDAAVTSASPLGQQVALFEPDTNKFAVVDMAVGRPMFLHVDSTTDQGLAAVHDWSLPHGEKVQAAKWLNESILVVLTIDPQGRAKLTQLHRSFSKLHPKAHERVSLMKAVSSVTLGPADRAQLDVGGGFSAVTLTQKGETHKKLFAHNPLYSAHLIEPIKTGDRFDFTPGDLGATITTPAGNTTWVMNT